MKAKNLMDVKDLEGKDIIDAKGKKVGKVDDIQIDVINRRVVSIISKEDTLSAKIGLGESRIIPIEIIQSLGENVVLNRTTL